MTQAYPLQWPMARPRTASRRSAAFNKKVRVSGKNYDETKSLTVADALDRLQIEINRLGAEDAILSTNLPLNLNGSPKSNAPAPSDPGVALYFKIHGKPHCLPCDTFNRVADNVVAISKHIEATRAIERYGVATIAEMFTGFAALPAPGAARSWREVLGGIDPDFTPAAAVIERRYRELAKERHPDQPGGSNAAMAELNRARDEALREVSP